jgi:hypothetical protein
MEQPETPPLRPSRGRPRIDKFWAVDAMILNGAGELFRTGHCRTPTGAIREFISRLWAGDHQAVLEIAPAFGPDYRDAVARAPGSQLESGGFLMGDGIHFRKEVIRDAEAVFA